MRLFGYLSLVVLVCPAVAMGQDKGGDEDGGPVGIFQSGQEYSQFMGAAKQLAYGEEGNLELQAMLPLLNDMVLNRPVGSTSQQYGGQASMMGLIGNPRVREDLEIVDEQYEEFQRKATEAQQRAAQQLREFDFEDRNDLVRQIQKIQEQTRQELDSVLLPHQMDRLKQIRAQSLLRNRSFVDAITSEPMRSELDITHRQAEALRREEQEIQADLAKQIAELRDKARQRLIETLDRPQQQKIDQLLGDTFEFQPAGRKKPTGKGRAGKSKSTTGKTGKGGK